MLALLALTGCAGIHGPVYRAARGGDPVWPEAPEPARIGWAGEYRSETDGYVRPHGVGLALDGALCVADPGARVVWLHRAGRPTSQIGWRHLQSPVDCTFMTDGMIAVADSAAGAVVAFDGRGKEAWRTAIGTFQRPAGLAMDRESARLLVADAAAHRVLTINDRGEVLRSLGARGHAPGQFNFPTAVAVGPEGRVYVLDALNFRVQVFSPEGSPLAAFGVAGDGPGTFHRPRGIGVDGAGRIYVADALFDNVQVFDAEGQLLLAFGSQGRGPGQFWMAAGVAVDSAGTIVVADAYNRRVQLFRLLDQPELEVH